MTPRAVSLVSRQIRSLVPVGKDKKRQLVNLPHDLAVWLEATAEVNRRSMSAFILDRVYEYLETQDPAEAKKVLTLIQRKIEDQPELAEHFKNSDLLEGLEEMAQ